MIGRVLALLVLASAGAAAAAPARVPFVGCASDGQMGPPPAPRYGTVPSVPPAVGAQLAYYAMRDHPGNFKSA